MFPKGKGEDASKPESGTGEETVEDEIPIEAKDEEALTEETQRPEPFKFEFDPSEFEGK